MKVINSFKQHITVEQFLGARDELQTYLKEWAVTQDNGRLGKLIYGTPNLPNLTQDAMYRVDDQPLSVTKFKQITAVCLSIGQELQLLQEQKLMEVALHEWLETETRQALCDFLWEYINTSLRI